MSVGSELLLGDLVDTNAAWVSQRLRELGVGVHAHVAVGDELNEMVRTLRDLIARSDLVVVGGGLGPTSDDITREAIAAAADLELESRPDLEDRITELFASRGYRMSPSNLRQARVPAGARVFDPVGTAPGFVVEVPRPDDAATCAVYALPGVPWELQELFVRDVAPDVLARSGGRATVTRVVHVAGLGESTVGEAVADTIADADAAGDVAIAFLATRREIQVRVTASGEGIDDARARTQPYVDRIVGSLGPVVAGIDDEDLEQAVVRLLEDRGESVATAESATAGGIAARLARVPGTSGVLKGGVAVYATDSKSRVLGVDPKLIEAHGPVSAEVTSDLAVRVRELFAADWGIGVTGVAGPSTQGGQDVGTAFWAVARPDGEVEVHGRNIPGDRLTVQERLGSAALELLRRRLLP
ncbi:MAG: CinA family nicotinamide mononucleotide deamidase-related protein [Actinobacteria bacterium]|nr:CinA family nicotinamide mononucleotide deamidase-related protein [Actinomycetota bacterium]